MFSSRRRARDLIFLYKCIYGLIGCPDLTINIHVPSRFLWVSPTSHGNQIIPTSNMTRIQHLYDTLGVAADIDVFNPTFVAFVTNL